MDTFGDPDRTPAEYAYEVVCFQKAHIARVRTMLKFLIYNFKHPDTQKPNFQNIFTETEFIIFRELSTKIINHDFGCNVD